MLKSFPARFKAAAAGDTALPAGAFEAIVSVFGNRDSWGDVVQPGAFAETLADWETSGAPIPVLYSHRMDDPRYNIGQVLDAAELAAGDERIPEWANDTVKSNGGLWVRAQLDTGDDASDVALATRRLMNAKRINQMSFAYDVVDAGWGELDGQEAYELRKLKLYEVSPTLIGANDQTQVLDSKRAEHMPLKVALLTARQLLTPGKAGRVLSSKNEAALRDAVELIQGVLAAVEDDGKAGAAPVKVEEPPGAKTEEPHQDPSMVRLLCDIDELFAEVASA